MAPKSNSVMNESTYGDSLQICELKYELFTKILDLFQHSPQLKILALAVDTKQVSAVELNGAQKRDAAKYSFVLALHQMCAAHLLRSHQASAAVAIVRALQDWNFDKPGLLILDEPTAALNRGEVDALFSEVRRVASLGVGVVFVSHMLEEVLDLADKVTVLRDGNVVASGENVKSLNVGDLVQLMVGRDLSLERNPKETEHGRVVLEAENLFGITLRGVSLKAHAGEIVGVAGLIGSGREEVANCLFGVTPRFMGKVLVNKRKSLRTHISRLKHGWH